MKTTANKGRRLRAIALGSVTLAAIGFAAYASWSASPGNGASDPQIASHWPFGPTFASQPPIARPVPGSACEVAEKYVTSSGPEIPALFAQDGLFMGPYDIVYRGPKEIALWYARPGAHEPKPSETSPHIIPLSFTDRGDECFMELAQLRAGNDPTAAPGYRLVAIDHFTVDQDGKIKRLVIYIRPDPLDDAVRQGISHGRADWPQPPSSNAR